MSKINKIGYIYTPLVLLLYIVVNVILMKSGSALCETSSCKIVDKTINIDSLYLNILGALFAISLLVTYKLPKISNFILYCGLLFESLMIGYQFFVVGTLCYYCLGIYALVWIIAISRLKFLVPFSTLAVVAVFYFMVKFVVLSTTITDTSNKTFLFGTHKCEHCKEIKSFLSDQNVVYEFKDVTETNNQFMMKFFKISSIPLLVVKEVDSIKMLLTKEDIKKYYGTKKPKSFDLNDMMKNSILNDNSGGGCKVDLPVVVINFY